MQLAPVPMSIPILAGLGVVTESGVLVVRRVVMYWMYW